MSWDKSDALRLIIYFLTIAVSAGIIIFYIKGAITETKQQNTDCVIVYHIDNYVCEDLYNNLKSISLRNCKSKFNGSKVGEILNPVNIRKVCK